MHCSGWCAAFSTRSLARCRFVERQNEKKINKIDEPRRYDENQLKAMFAGCLRNKMECVSRVYR